MVEASGAREGSTIQTWTMHETALAQQMVRTIVQVAEENGGHPVVSALLHLGAMTHVEPSTLSFAFEAAARDTLAAGCELVIQRIPLRTECQLCAWKGEVEPDAIGCPSCGGVGLKVLTGREIQLVSIDVDDESGE